jgi:hypothetical protein
MKDIIPSKKQSPILGLTGLGGGVGSNLGGSAAEKLYGEDVFSTYVYSGNNGAQTGLGPGVDMTKGGLAWVKRRSAGESHYFFDSERIIGGVYQSLASNNANAQDPRAWNIAFNNNGLAFNDNDGGINASGSTYVNWQFRKAKGFFDVVTYTGTGSSRTVAHSLGCIPGMIIVKQTNSAANWTIYHRDNGNTKAMYFTTAATYTDSAWWNNTDPTDSVFTLGNSDGTNKSGQPYVAYVFAGGESTAASARSLDFQAAGAELLLNTAAIPSGKDSNQFCLETWFKPDDNTDENIIYGQYDASQTGRMMLKYTQNKVLLWQGGNDTNLTTGNSSVFGGQWYHLAWTYDGTNHRLYLNGILKSTLAGSSLSADITPNNPRIGDINVSGYNFDGKMSNFRVTHGQVVYTSSFKPSYQPLTTTSQGVTASNVKLLCCNNASRSNNDGTGITLTRSGQVVAITDSPFDDLDGFKFGEEEDQNMIKTGSYVGNANSNGPEVYMGWEPQFFLVKNATTTNEWLMFDSMRGVVTGANDARLSPTENSAEYGGMNAVSFTPTGVKLTETDSRVNGNGDKMIYVAIRFPDGYVGKPPELGTDVFAMDIGNGSSTIPNFDSGFPIDFALVKKPAATQDWYVGSRLTQKKFMYTNGTSAEGDSSEFLFDSNVGWMKGTANDSSYQSWMWKRHAGFDVMTYTGDGTYGRGYYHNLGRVPEMIWIKNRGQSVQWVVGHEGMNNGTNDWNYYMILNSTSAKITDTKFLNTTPTSTSFTTSADNDVNQNTREYIAFLFASVEGISKVDSYSGNGSANLTITTGFQPRFLIIKRSDGTGAWHVFDSLRGMGGTDKLLRLDNTGAQLDVNYVTVSSTGWNTEGTSLTNGNYIYYAHA